MASSSCSIPNFGKVMRLLGESSTEPNSSDSDIRETPLEFQSPPPPEDVDINSVSKIEIYKVRGQMIRDNGKCVKLMLLIS